MINNHKCDVHREDKEMKMVLFKIADEMSSYIQLLGSLFLIWNIDKNNSEDTIRETLMSQITEFYFWMINDP